MKFIINGIVNLKEGSRISDAIEQAGGCTEEADLSNVNLAYILQDGTKIYIPKLGEEKDNIIEVGAGDDIVKGDKQESKININTANLEELQNIPGIGEATAQKIINYREKNGKFSTIKDLTNVSGIGEAKLENMREYISVK